MAESGFTAGESWEWKGRWLTAQDGSLVLSYTINDDGVHATPAHARLIAAAPEIFASAMALVDRDCRYSEGDVVIPCGSHGEAIRLLADLRAALLKAQGPRP